MHFIKYGSILGGLLSIWIGFILIRDAVANAMLMAFDPMAESSMAGAYAGGLLMAAGLVAVVAGSAAIGNTLSRLEQR